MSDGNQSPMSTLTTATTASAATASAAHQQRRRTTRLNQFEDPRQAEAADAEMQRRAERGFEEILRADPHLGMANTEIDCRTWELEKMERPLGAEGAQEDIEERLAVRVAQHRIVVELVNTMLKKNYTRFVDGMNKIHEVGLCSEQTTIICDEGKSRIAMTKDGLARRALLLRQRHRRRANLEALRSLTEKMRAVAAQQQAAQRLLSEKRFAEAAISMTKGLRHAETLGLEGVASVQTILTRWVGDKDRIYTRHLERDLAEGCKCFDAARFELCLQAIGGMGPTYAAESAKGLPEKWATALGLISLASVMPYAVSAAASAAAGGGAGAGGTDAFAPGATVRKLMKMVRSDAAAQALLQLLANAAYSVWCYNATIRLLRRTLDAAEEKKKEKKESESGDNNDDDDDDDDDAVVSARRVFLRAMEQGRALFFGEVQDKVGECYASMHLHSLTLESFFVLIFAFRMLAALGRSFGEEMGKGVCVLYARFIAAYMGDVLHKEACEITRVGLVFDSLKPLSAAKVVERVSKQYEVATDGATPTPSPAAAAAAANPAMAAAAAAAAAASAEIPASILLELIVRKTEAFLSSEDPSQSPFIRVLQNCQRRQAAAAATAAQTPAASQNEHASALRSLFAPEELMVIQMNLPNMMNAATTTTPAAAAAQAKRRPSQQPRKGSAAAADEQQQRARHTIKAGAVTLPEVLTEGGVEAMLRVLRYCELLSSCGSSVGAESTELVGSLLLRYVSFYAYTTVMDYCGVAPRGASSSGCLQWFTHALNSAGSGAGEAPAVAEEAEEEEVQAAAAAASQPPADAEAAAPASSAPAAKGMTAAAAAAALELSGLLPRAIKGLGAFAPMQRDGSKQVAFLSYFAEQDARLPQEVRTTLLEMRAATLSVLGHKRKDAAVAAVAATATSSSSSSSGDEAEEGGSGSGGGGVAAASAEENAILAHHLRVQNPALLRRLSGAEGAAHAADERFRALDTASALLDVLGQMLAGGAGAGGVQETASTARLRASAARVGAALSEVGRLLAQRLALLLFPTDGYAKLVGEAKWERKSVETEPSPHVYAIMKDIRTFAETLDTLGVSAANAELLWTSLVDALWGALVEGLSRVRKCTNEGRALMSLDLQTLQHSLKSVVQGSTPASDMVEEYIKAFYLDSDDYVDWVTASHARYTVKQLTALCTINTGVLDRKRKDRQDQAKRVEELLTRVQHVDPPPVV